MLYVFTGNGKGKTSSTIGMGIRAIGRGKKVLMIQFLKPKNFSSESRIIKKIKNFELRNFGRKGFFLPKESLKKKPELEKKGVKSFSEKDFKLALQGFDLAKKAAQSKKYHLLILDEINLLLKFKLINLKEVLDFLKEHKKNLDIVLTGRDCPKEIIKIADLVTEMKEIKHYYKKGIKARQGIEY